MLARRSSFVCHARRSPVVFLAPERSAVLFLALGIVPLPGLTSGNIAQAQGEAQTTQPQRSVAVAKEPALLVAPFGEKEARSACQAWAAFQHVAPELKSSVGVQLTLIPAGEFQMGSTQAQLDQLMHADATFEKETADHDKPQHRVRITRPFYIGTCEVTKGQFRQFVDDMNYVTDAEKDGNGGVGPTGKWRAEEAFNYDAKFTWRDWGVAQADEEPVVNVSHNDACAFCRWLSKKDGRQYRLPTEAEWEYACRAGTTGLYYCGDDSEDLAKIANVADAAALEKFPSWDFTIASSDGWPYTARVGKLRPNNFGVHDMTGNVWEWCADWFDPTYYANSPVSDPPGSAAGTERVIRGGSWRNPAAWCTSFQRQSEVPSDRSCFRGFRVAADASGKQ
jgi:formylglycine-generating enzyme